MMADLRDVLTARPIGWKVQPPLAPDGRFTKADFTIDLAARTVTCPTGRSAPLRRTTRGALAKFGAACTGCPLTERCTSAKEGRTISVEPHEAQLARARAVQQDPAWQVDYRATRAMVERKIAHLMRRRHGGRRARVRGRLRVGADSPSLPPRPTSPGSPCSASSAPARPGWPGPPDRGSGDHRNPVPGPKPARSSMIPDGSAARYSDDHLLRRSRPVESLVGRLKKGCSTPTS